MIQESEHNLRGRIAPVSALEEQQPNTTVTTRKSCGLYQQDPTHQAHKLCILDYVYNKNWTVYCEASIDGTECESCVSLPFCGSADPWKTQKGHKVDCGNVDSKFRDARVCDNKITLWDWKHYNKYNTHNQHQSDDIFGAGFVVVIIVWVLILIALCAACRYPRAVLYSAVDEHDDNEEQPRAELEMGANTTHREQGRVVHVFVDRNTGRAAAFLQDESNPNLVRALNVPGGVGRSDGSSRPPLSLFSLFDPAKDDSNAVLLREAVSANEWKPVRDLLETLGSSGDIDGRSFYMQIVLNAIEQTWKDSDADIFSPMLDSWVGFEPDNIDCRLLRGNAYIRWAWFARTASYASHVPADAWPKFFHRLELASAEVQRAVELDRSEALAYAPLITYERGRKDRLPERVKKHLSALAESSEPLNFEAHCSALQFYCRKWGGSDDEMFEFARSVTNGLPDGHPLWILIVQAHFEKYLSLKSALASLVNSGRRPPAPILNRLAATVSGYWKQEDVRSEILHSYRHYIGSPSHNKMGDASPYAKNIAHTARNWYIYSLARTGDLAFARRECQEVGPHPSERPWHYFGDPITEYRDFCSKLGITFSSQASGGPASIDEDS